MSKRGLILKAAEGLYRKLDKFSCNVLYRVGARDLIEPYTFFFTGFESIGPWLNDIDPCWHDLTKDEQQDIRILMLLLFREVKFPERKRRTRTNQVKQTLPGGTRCLDK